MYRILAILVAALGLGRVCYGETTTTRPWPGVTLEREVWVDPRVRFFVVDVDLSDPRVHLKVSRGGQDSRLTPPWQTTLMPVTEMARRDGLTVAVNGNLFDGKDYQTVLGRKFYYFKGNWAKACGWAMSDGVVYSGWMLGFPSMVIHADERISFGKITRLPEDARQVVSGIWQIITDGKITVDPDSPSSEFGQPAPHTAVGVDRDGKRLILFVVDGRRPEYSVGMGLHQMAEQMLARGAWNALVLDGGGSATLVLRDRNGSVNVLNRPSDGHDLPMNLSVERCVANALGVIVDPATRPSAP